MDVTAISTTPNRPREALRFELFGEMRVRAGAHDVTPRLPGRQGRALLARLLLNHPRPVSRDQLLHVLWPCDPPEAPEAALRSVLAKVRRAFGPDLTAGRESLTLTMLAGARIDAGEATESVRLAERALAGSDPATALTAARAALDVLARPLLPCLEGEWIERWRGHYEDLELRALTAAADAGMQLGGHELGAAERAARAVVERAPYSEAGYALLMRSQAQRGDGAEALRTFDRLRVLLRDELGVSPSGEVLALHDELLHPQRTRVAIPERGPGDERVVELPAVAPRTAEGGFVGRRAVLDRLRERWRESRDGNAALVMLVGEAGVGKTRLACEFAADVHHDAGAVLYGRADADALLPHQPFVEALQHLLGGSRAALLLDFDHERALLARILPELRSGAAPAPADASLDEDALRYQVFEAVVALLVRASRSWPLLLVLDDLHWADKPTLLLLRHLLRHPDLSRVLILGAFRDVEVDADHPLLNLLTDLRRERRYDRIALGGLDAAETRALVTTRGATHVTAGFVRRLCEQTDGNAFFIEETIRALAELGLPPAQAGTEHALERLGVPEGVAEVISRRVRRLSPAAATILTTASVLGRTFSVCLLEAVADECDETVLEALDEAITAGLLVEVPDRADLLSFAHALVREVLYGRVPNSRRARLHHRVAEALEASDSANPAELALHFHCARHLAGPGPARRYSFAAGHQANRLLAYEDAAGHFRRALALSGDDDAPRCEILLALGRVQWRIGDDEARQSFLAAADSAARRREPTQLARAALGLGERFWEAAYVGSRYRELLADAVGTSDLRLRALLLARLGHHLAFPHEDERALEPTREALAIARQLGDDGVLAGALLARHVAMLDIRHLDERLALAHELRAFAAGHRELAAEATHWRLYDLLEAGELGQARREQPRLDALANQLGQPLFRSIAAGWRGLWAELDGDLEAAEAHAEQCLRDARTAHAPDAVSIWAAKLFRHRRRHGRTAELRDVVERLARSDEGAAGWPIALAVLQADTGEHIAARRGLDAAMAVAPEAMPRGIFWLTRIALLSELCATLRDADAVRVLYAALKPHAGATSSSRTRRSGGQWTDTWHCWRRRAATAMRLPRTRRKRWPGPATCRRRCSPASSRPASTASSDHPTERRNP